MQIVNMHEAKTHLSRLVDAAVDGESITIAKVGEAPRPPGAHRGGGRVAALGLPAGTGAGSVGLRFDG